MTEGAVQVENWIFGTDSLLIVVQDATMINSPSPEFWESVVAFRACCVILFFDLLEPLVQLTDGLAHIGLISAITSSGA